MFLRTVYINNNISPMYTYFFLSIENTGFFSNTYNKNSMYSHTERMIPVIGSIFCLRDKIISPLSKAFIERVIPHPGQLKLSAV